MNTILTIAAFVAAITIFDWMNGTGVEAPAVWKKDIDASPTIIEEEAGE